MTPVYDIPNQAASGATLSARLAKKPISAGRRLQNRKAQKAYRDRKRERLRELESRLAVLQNAPATVSPIQKTGSTLSSITTAQTLALESGGVSRPFDTSQQSVSSSLPDPVHNASRWDDTSLWLSPILPEITFPFMNVGDSELAIPESYSIDEDFGLCDSPIIHTPDHIESSSISSPTRMLSLQFQHAASHQSPMHTKETSFKSSSKPAHPKSIYIYRPSGKQVSITPRVVRDYLMSLPKTTQRHLHGLAKGGDFSFVDIIQSLMQVACDANHTPRHLETLPPVIQASVEPATYSPYRNVLRIARFSYFAALFANFSSLGFEFSSFLDENSVSPFCGHADGDADESNFPDSLRPLLSQRTISHHPYIDSLPFPSFRRRALAALSTEPPLLDEDDLCIDLMLNDGLVCWGSAGDNGSDYGTPWDSHSWEAKEWFLRKWWWLVGGQDGELHHSSRWWASQRGEKVSLHAS